MNRNLVYERDSDQSIIVKVGGGSDPNSVAHFIANAFYEDNRVAIRAVGAAAVNQAVKAVAISRGHIASRGQDSVARIGFINVDGFEGKGAISAIVFRLSLV